MSIERNEKECKIWYDNGQSRAQGYYRNGLREGEFKSWLPNGLLEHKGFYRDGKNDGESIFWLSNMTIFRMFYHVHGNLLDAHFTKEKKLSFLRIKRALRNNITYPTDTFLISDLINIV